MWLLRDVVLALPKGCHDIKDYFLSKVKYAKFDIIFGEMIFYNAPEG